MIYINAVMALLACTMCGVFYLHMTQLESYQPDGYARWLRRVGVRGVWGPLLIGLIGWSEKNILLGIASVLLSGVWLVYNLRAANKKPIVFTARMRRQAGAYLAVSALCSLIAAYLGAGMLAVCFTPLYALLALFIMGPHEKAVNKRYFDDAARMLRERTDLIKIGITGSYGKTSTKRILTTILSEKYSVLTTPQSKNTPMGVTIVVRNELKPIHQVFVAEMGARHVGDIREMCELVGPTVGVLTSVGPQHLETFGTVEAVASTKYELIEALPEDGYAVFSASEHCMELYERTALEKSIAGFEYEGLTPPITAEDIKVTPRGSEFRLITPIGEVACSTVLLGRHNIQNILIAVAVALKLGLSLAQIKSGIARVEPIEHRLQLIPAAGGAVVIDDAFNANPAGTKAALEVLAGFGGRRIIVTPGMVELGAEEAAYNKAFGVDMAAVCDIVILVGSPNRAKPMYDGLEEAGFDKTALHVVPGLKDAQAILAGIMKPGDVVLYENDLPDNY